MRFFRKNLKIITFLLSLNIIFVSCNKYDDDVIQNNDINGQELFKSVFFGLGDFSEKITIFNSKKNDLDAIKKEDLDRMNSDIDKLLSEIELNNPGFFDSFALSVKSNNHSQIETSLEEASFLLMKNIRVIVPEFDTMFSKIENKIKSKNIEINSQEDIDNFVSNLEQSEYDSLLNENILSNRLSPCSWVLACVVYFVLAIHNQVAIASNAAVAISVYLWVALWGPPLDNYKKGPIEFSSPSLQKEMLIEELSIVKWL